MKKLTLATATIAALLLTSAPAIASDNNQGAGNDRNKNTQSGVIEVVGVVKSVLDTSTVTVSVKETSDARATKDLTRAMRNATITVKADSATVVVRSGVAAAFTTVAVNDRVNMRVRCVAGAPIVCVAKRITATVPKLHLGLNLRGVVVSNTAGLLGVAVVALPEVGNDNTFKAKALLGTLVTLHTDSATVVTKAGAAVTVASLVNFPVVNVQATCTTAIPAVCTAKRIAVIVPSA